jgi:hypothetical protein
MVQPIQARGPGQPEPSPLYQPSTPLRTASQIGQQTGWTPPPRTSGPYFRPPQPTSQPAPEPAQGAAESVRSVVTGVGQQWRSDRVKNALLAGLRGYQRAQYFRHAGGLEALKYALDPAGYRTHPIISVRTPRTVGLDPDRIHVVEHGHW